MTEFFSLFSSKELDDDLDISVSELNINDESIMDVFVPDNVLASNVNKTVNDYQVETDSSIDVNPEDDTIEITKYDFDDHEFDFDSPVSFNDNMDEEPVWNSTNDFASPITEDTDNHAFDTYSASDSVPRVSGISTPTLVTPDKSFGQYGNERSQSMHNQQNKYRDIQGCGIFESQDVTHSLNLTEYERRDSFSHTYLRLINELALKLGANQFLHRKDQISAYNAIRNNLELQFKQILRNTCSPHVYDYNVDTSKETRLALDALYEDTIVQMNQLIAHTSATMYGTHSNEMTLSNNFGQRSMSSPSCGVRTNATASKKEFVTYMTAWLRNNWTNPYNDDEGLEKMAVDTGCTTEVISNWLINARTRKWRPSLRKALALNRPASYLLEDSLNIFDRKPVQGIGSADDQRQSFSHIHHNNNHNNNVVQPLVCSSSVHPVEVFPLYQHQQWMNTSSNWMEDPVSFQSNKRIKTQYHQM